MATTVEDTIICEFQTCASCGVRFAAPEHMLDEKRKAGGSFYCPNGHVLTFRDTENARLKRELEAQKLATVKERENFFAEQRKHEQTTKELKRTKKRVANGVCPCCHRTVSQLSRHMKTKHPEFVAETKTS